MYLNLTDTDSCSCFFNFVCKKEWNIKESKSRKLIFESLQNSKIVERLDVSDKFWQQFKIQDVMLESRWDCMRLKIVIIQITVNPKEYF